MPGLVRDGHGRRFVRVHVALIVPDVGAPHLIERGLLGLRALLAAQLQIGQLLLGGGLLVQPLFARFEQRLLLHLERELADLLDGAAPDFSALPGEVCLDASVIFQNLRDATHGSYGPGWDSRERRTARCHADRNADHPVQNESRRAIQWYRSVGSRIVIVPTSRAHPGAASSYPSPIQAWSASKDRCIRLRAKRRIQPTLIELLVPLPRIERLRLPVRVVGLQRAIVRVAVLVAGVVLPVSGERLLRAAGQDRALRR